MLLLKRANVPLDRDVIFLAESGEEGTTRVGIELMANQHFPAIDAEYCYAEGGDVTRQAGQVRYASVQTMEKIPRGIDLISRGIAGHGSVPLPPTPSRTWRARWRACRMASADHAQRHDGRLLQAAGRAVAARRREALSRRAQPGSEGLRPRRHVAAAERAAARVDAAHVGFAEHHPGRLPQQRDPVGSAGHARRAVHARRGSAALPRAGEEGGERSRRGGGVQRLAGREGGTRPGGSSRSTPKRSRWWKPR